MQVLGKTGKQNPKNFRKLFSEIICESSTEFQTYRAQNNQLETHITL
jgi:hypothetical protein